MFGRVVEGLDAVDAIAGVRTGRATPTLLDGIKPEAYGTRTPIKELANVSVEDARTLRIIPWDKELLKVIEKGITDADLGKEVVLFGWVNNRRDHGGDRKSVV